MEAGSRGKVTERSPNKEVLCVVGLQLDGP